MNIKALGLSSVVALLLPLASAYAQQVPWGRADAPVSSRDRVYAANQTSNTVSVIDPSSNTLLGVIRLGDPVPAALSPLYTGQLLVQALGYSRLELCGLDRDRHEQTQGRYLPRPLAARSILHAGRP